MAPPYMRIIPQFTYSSISFHLTSFRMKRSTTEARDMLARPILLPRKTHARTVTAIIAPTAYSV